MPSLFHSCIHWERLLLAAPLLDTLSAGNQPWQPRFLRGHCWQSTQEGPNKSKHSESSPPGARAGLLFRKSLHGERVTMNTNRSSPGISDKPTGRSVFPIPGHWWHLQHARTPTPILWRKWHFNSLRRWRCFSCKEGKERWPGQRDQRILRDRDLGKCEHLGIF